MGNNLCHIKKAGREVLKNFTDVLIDQKGDMLNGYFSHKQAQMSGFLTY